MWASVALTAVSAFFLPTRILSSFACSFYTVGITVLSIIFSLFFACLAILISFSDNDFIKYIEQRGHFTKLIKFFKFTLLILFFSLIYSIVSYQYFDFFVRSISEQHTQHKIFFLVFEFLFSYSLLATAYSVRDTIKFSERRTTFMMSEAVSSHSSPISNENPQAQQGNGIG